MSNDVFPDTISKIAGNDSTEVNVNAGDPPCSWLPYSKVKVYTNAFIVQDGKVRAPQGYSARGDGERSILLDSVRI